MLTTNIQTLFNCFQNGFYHFDLAKVVDCYHLPCTLNTPDKMSLINTKTELELEINNIFEQLANECFVRFELSNTSFTQLTDDLLFASINWRFIDKTNQVFSEFSAFYHLSIKDKELKIINATSHQISNSKNLSNPFALTVENNS
ncbi:MAG: hypothetical protein MJK12_15195 [Colwellia sp.]|nr:hypothetical protein [Colwellia sp.]